MVIVVAKKEHCYLIRWNNDNSNDFDYDKIKNVLIASGNVVIDDKINQTIIYSNKITYIKNDELFFTE